MLYCVYGLIALGFVLIYKAAEQVNFAQGDLMMLGAFVAVGLANDAYLGLPFWLACIGAIVVMAAIGWLLERAILRRVFARPRARSRAASSRCWPSRADSWRGRSSCCWTSRRSACLPF